MYCDYDYDITVGDSTINRASSYSEEERILLKPAGRCTANIIFNLLNIF